MCNTPGCVSYISCLRSIVHQFCQFSLLFFGHTKRLLLVWCRHRNHHFLFFLGRLWGWVQEIYRTMSGKGDSPENLDLPRSRHFRKVPSRLALTIQGSTWNLPGCPATPDLRIHRRSAMTSCQCASTSPRSSGSSGEETSYARIMSPDAVRRYGSARGVVERGRRARTEVG